MRRVGVRMMYIGEGMRRFGAKTRHIGVRMGRVGEGARCIGEGMSVTCKSQVKLGVVFVIYDQSDWLLGEWS